MERKPDLADLTTLRVGGAPQRYVKADSQDEIVGLVRRHDRDGEGPLLVLGGGSNLVVSDQEFPGLVVHVKGEQIRVLQGSRSFRTDDETVVVEVGAGTEWDQVVRRAVAEGWSGLEALSGIPGNAGAAPVQNIGAYGREVGQNLISVRAWDRATETVVTLTNDDLRLGYRDSVLKRSLRAQDEDGHHPWGPTGRWVVLSLRLRLEPSGLSAPIRYRELAGRLGVQLGERAPLDQVRQAVLDLRRSKGMVLDGEDHDTWSAGSFFTNPILSVADAAKLLPLSAPRFRMPPGSVPEGDEVKTSAAWLIEQAGFHKGYGVHPDARARLSSKHVLAITNRGGATSDDVAALAHAVRFGVEDYFGITLIPEPVLVGVQI